jgi:hypothetical protein
MQQSGAADFVRSLPPEHRIFEVPGAGCLRIDRHLEASNQRFARADRETHVRVKAHDEHSVGADRMQPDLDVRAAERPVHILLKERLRPESGLLCSIGSSILEGDQSSKTAMTHIGKSDDRTVESFGCAMGPRISLVPCVQPYA